jgi:hypothetical protein
MKFKQETIDSLREGKFDNDMLNDSNMNMNIVDIAIENDLEAEYSLMEGNSDDLLMVDLIEAVNKI